jgi:hypothetical protein
MSMLTELVLAGGSLLTAALGGLWLWRRSKRFDRIYGVIEEPRSKV